MNYTFFLSLLLINSDIVSSENGWITEQPKEVLAPICLAGIGLGCVSCAPQCGVCCAACTLEKTLCAAVMEATGSGLFCCSLGCLLANCQQSK
ncbi:MAG: hypothetical protein LVQ75_00970 [Candidatus Babeliales bacterium]|jgi:hypothetical protein